MSSQDSCRYPCPDSVTCDSVGVQIVGQVPQSVDFLRWLNESGLGEIKNFKIVGDSIEPLKEIFVNS